MCLLLQPWIGQLPVIALHALVCAVFGGSVNSTKPSQIPFRFGTTTKQ